MASEIFKKEIKARSLRLIFIFYWFFLSYTLATLAFWYSALIHQTKTIYEFRVQTISLNDPGRSEKVQMIESIRERKNAQYAGEGATFLLLIVTGAIYIFRLIRRQLTLLQQQQNFMMAITHELKTPIAVTRLNLETIQMRKLDESRRLQLISSTVQEVNRLNTLFNNMLLTSQIDSGRYIITHEKFDVGVLVDDCVEDFKTRFPFRNMEVEIKDENIISGDRLQMQLAINNLLDNALKYSGKDNVVLIKVFKADLKIVLQVIDEGRGIDAREKAKVFNKYFRGINTQTKGTGLGLYLTKEIVRQHRGSISVRNNIPHGSVFEIQFKIPKSSKS